LKTRSLLYLLLLRILDFFSVTLIGWLLEYSSIYFHSLVISQPNNKKYPNSLGSNPLKIYQVTINKEDENIDILLQFSIPLNLHQNNEEDTIKIKLREKYEKRITNTQYINLQIHTFTETLHYVPL